MQRPPPSHPNRTHDQVHFGNPLHVWKNLTGLCFDSTPWPLGAYVDSTTTEKLKLPVALGNSSDTWALMPPSSLPGARPALTPKQRRFSASAPSSKIPIKTQRGTSNRKGFLLLRRRSLIYRPPWLMSEIETTKSKLGDATQHPEVCQNRFYFITETLDFLWEAETGFKDSARWRRTALILLDNFAKHIAVSPETGASHPSLPAPSTAELNRENLDMFAPYSLLLNLECFWGKATHKASRRGCFSSRRCKLIPKKKNPMKIRIFLMFLEMALQPSSRCLTKDHGWARWPGMAPRWKWVPAPVSVTPRLASPKFGISSSLVKESMWTHGLVLPQHLIFTLPALTRW